MYVFWKTVTIEQNFPLVSFWEFFCQCFDNDVIIDTILISYILKFLCQYDMEYAEKFIEFKNYGVSISDRQKATFCKLKGLYNYIISFVRINFTNYQWCQILQQMRFHHKNRIYVPSLVLSYVLFRIL